MILVFVVSDNITLTLTLVIISWSSEINIPSLYITVSLQCKSCVTQYFITVKFDLKIIENIFYLINGRAVIKKLSGLHKELLIKLMNEACLEFEPSVRSVAFVVVHPCKRYGKD